MLIFIIFSCFTEEERSRDHYRELITEEQNLGFDKDDLKIVDTLNAEQIAGYEEILDHVL